MNTEVTVIVTLQVEGIHRWEDCPLPEVAYLRADHRHLFHIKVEKRVSHYDRDVEIISLKHDLSRYLLRLYGDCDGVCHFGKMSCEMIARELLESFNLRSCTVLEDGENGARVSTIREGEE